MRALKLPGGSRAIYLYRDGHFLMPGDDTALKAGDEVVILLHGKYLPEITKRWSVSAKD